MSSSNTNTDGEGGDMLEAIGPASAIVKLVPWYYLITKVRTLRGPRLTILGPTASGKSTLWRVLENKGDLVEIRDHVPTEGMKPSKGYHIEFNAGLGVKELFLRNITDTPGHRYGNVPKNVADYIASYEPRILVFVIDLERDFTLDPDDAQRDTSKWFKDLRIAAEDVDEGKWFRGALAKVGCVIIMLNKANKIYDNAWNELLEGKVTDPKRRAALLNIKGTGTFDNQASEIEKGLIQQVEDRVSTTIQDYSARSRSMIGDIFAKAGHPFPEGDMKVVPCCFVIDSEKKKNDMFDRGHYRMFDIIRSFVGQ